MKLWSICRKLLTQSMIGCLVTSLSGVLPIFRQAQAAPPHLDLQAMTQQAQDLDDALQLQIRRARHPGTPGTPDGVPNLFDVNQLEDTFNKWKAQMESALALPEEPQAPGDDYLPAQAKLRGVNSYLNELMHLATLRIALGLEHGAAWSDPLCLRVPQAVIAEIPGLGTQISNRMGDRFNPMVVDRSQEASNGSACLKISASLVQGLELGRLADVQNDDTNLTMIKYLATRQLLSNLNDLRYLKSDHQVQIPEIPAPLRAKLESMGMASEIAEEQHRAVAEPGARTSILKTYDQVASQFPPFVSDELLTQLSQAIGQTPQQAIDARAPLKEVLVKAEADNLSASLEQEITSASAPFSVQSSQELDESLRAALASAKANTLLQKIMEMLADQTLGELTVEQRRKVLDLLDARKAAYLGELGQDAIRSWQNAAKRATEDLLYTTSRDQFVENLLLHAPEAVKEVQRTFSGDVVDPEILAKVFAQDLIKLGPTETAGEWFYQIDSAGSYIAARAKYNEILAKQTTPDVLVGGVADPAKAEAYVASHDFTPPSQGLFTSNTPPELQARILTRIANTRRGDIRALLTYGGWMGFHKIYPGGTPGVNQVLTDHSKIDDYFQKLDEAARTEYPILGTQIEIVSPEGAESSGRLADALAAINPDHVDSQEILEKADTLVDQGLAQIEAKIRQDIETIGNAKSAAEIEKVVTSSMMLSLVMHGFPEFHIYEEQFIEDLLSPSLTDQIMRRYAGPAMAYGFGAIMLIKAVNWVAKKAVKRAFPVTAVIGTGVDMMMAGYIRAAMVLILADEAYEVSRYLHERADRQQQEDFSLCSAEGACFVDGGTLDAANRAYTLAKWTLVGRMAMDVAFFYFPMARQVYTRAADKVVLAELVADNDAFKKLGLQPGDFARVERAMKFATAIRDGKLDALAPEIVQANPANGDAWIPVDRGFVHSLNYKGLLIKVGNTSGWMRLSDYLTLEGLLVKNVGAAATSAESWYEVEQAYSRLSAKIRAGQTYRLPSVTDRVLVEDAFKTLDLSAKNPESWDKIEKARALHERASYDDAAAAKINRAARFLETRLAEDPEIRTRKFEPVSKAERKLLLALKRSPKMELMWQTLAAEDQKELHVDVPPPPSSEKPIPPINARGSTGGLPN